MRERILSSLLAHSSHKIGLDDFGPENGYYGVYKVGESNTFKRVLCLIRYAVFQGF